MISRSDSMGTDSLLRLVDPGLPRQSRITEHQEKRIEQRFLGVVAQWIAVEPQHRSAGAFDQHLRRGRVPFGGRAEARVEVEAAFGDAAELQRGTQADA